MPGIINRYDSSDIYRVLESTLQLQPQGLSDLDLNRKASRISKRKMKSLGIYRPHVGFAWNDEDNNTSRWYPQGIGGLKSDDDRKFLVISWYGKGSYSNKGVRVSFVDVTDMDRIRYRHVVLVTPNNAYNNLLPIQMHAGGIATKSNRLYIPDTSKGFRVFNENKIYVAEPNPEKDKCGIINGKIFAFNYRRIIPQEFYYQMDGPRFSFASIDYTDPSSPKLLTGNYHNPESAEHDNPPASLVWWNVDGHKIVSHERTETGFKRRTQGALCIDGRLFLSRSGMNPSRLNQALHRAKISQLSVSDNAHSSFKRYVWPYGCEDLHYSRNSTNIWCLTEHPGKRYVFAVKLSEYS